MVSHGQSPLGWLGPRRRPGLQCECSAFIRSGPQKLRIQINGPRATGYNNFQSWEEDPEGKLTGTHSKQTSQGSDTLCSKSIGLHACHISGKMEETLAPTTQACTISNNCELTRQNSLSILTQLGQYFNINVTSKVTLPGQRQLLSRSSRACVSAPSSTPAAVSCLLQDGPQKGRRCFCLGWGIRTMLLDWLKGEVMGSTGLGGEGSEGLNREWWDLSCHSCYGDLAKGCG